MNLSFVPASEQPAIYKHLARQYIEELHQYDGTLVFDNTVNWQSTIPFTNILFNEEEKPIGFLSVAVDVTVQPDPVLYIAEIFVTKDIRRAGAASTAVKQTIAYWSGPVYLHILNDNLPAKIFWDRTAKALGWKRQTDMSAYRHVDGTELRVYTQAKPDA